MPRRSRNSRGRTPKTTKRTATEKVTRPKSPDTRATRDGGDGEGAKTDFPKHSIDDALKVAKTIAEKNGGRPMPPIDLAIALGQSPASSSFRMLLSSSLRYGLTSGSYKASRISLQDLGRNIVEPKNPEGRQDAMIRAALTPPTFRALYDAFKGNRLPEAAFFENTLVRDFDVPREHAGKCVAVFTSNLDRLGLLRDANGAKWVSADASLPPALDEPEDDQDTDDEEDQRPAAPPFGGSTGRGNPFPPAKPPQEPPSPPRDIFVAHGKNKRPLEQLKAILTEFKVPFKVAIDEANRGRPISEKVAELMDTCGSAILIFTADEEFKDTKDNTVWRPSENAVFELGAASKMYGRKIILFKEQDVSFPTNYRDMGYIEFEKDKLSEKTHELFRELIAFGLLKLVPG